MVRRSEPEKYARVFIGIWIFWVLFYVAVLCTVGVVAFHFITKYW